MPELFLSERDGRTGMYRVKGGGSAKGKLIDACHL